MIYSSSELEAAALIIAIFKTILIYLLLFLKVKPDSIKVIGSSVSRRPALTAYSAIPPIIIFTDFFSITQCGGKNTELIPQHMGCFLPNSCASPWPKERILIPVLHGLHREQQSVHMWISFKKPNKTIYKAFPP